MILNYLNVRPIFSFLGLGFVWIWYPLRRRDLSRSFKQLRAHLDVSVLRGSSSRWAERSIILRARPWASFPPAPHFPPCCSVQGNASESQLWRSNIIPTVRGRKSNPFNNLSDSSRINSKRGMGRKAGHANVVFILNHSVDRDFRPPLRHVDGQRVIMWWKQNVTFFDGSGGRWASLDLCGAEGSHLGRLVLPQINRIPNILFIVSILDQVSFTCAHVGMFRLFASAKYFLVHKLERRQPFVTVILWC